MLLRLIAFELRYQLRQIVFGLSAAVFLVLGAALTSSGFGASNVHVNAPYVITLSLGLLSLGSIFLATAFCASAVLRDTEHGMVEIVEATAVSPRTRRFARFGGVLAATCAVLLAAAAGMLLACVAPWIDEARVGPIRLLPYARALLVLVLPNLLVVTALLFAVATWSRSHAGTYAAGLLVFVAYLTVATVTDSPLIAGSTPSGPEAMATAGVLDPFGLSAFLAQTLFWTPAERESQLVALTGSFLWNRAGVTTIGLLMVGATVLSSGRVLRLRRRPRRVAAPDAIDAPDTPSTARHPARPLAAPRAAETRPPRPARVVLRVARLECLLTLKSIPFLVMLVLWLFFLGMDLATGLGNQEYGAPSLAHSGAVVELIQGSMGLFLVLVMIYVSGEVAWRDRGARIDGLVDSTPAGDLALYLGKGLTLVVALVVMIGLAVIAGVTYQLSAGVLDIDVPLYLAVYGFKGVPLLMVGLLALFLQAVTPNKHVGMLLTLVVYLGTATTIGERLGIEHCLLRYSKSPPVLFSDMNGYGAFVTPFVWCMVYWGGLAALMTVVSYGLARRGLDEGLLARARMLPARWGRGGAMLAAVSAAVAVGAGGFIYYNTNVLNRYVTSEDRIDFEAAYELELERFRHVPQPKIVAVRADVDLYPSERRLHVEGEYTLRNTTDVTIERIMAGTPREVSTARLAIAGATIDETRPSLGVMWFTLAEPLAAGEEIALAFEADIVNPGFVNADPDLFLAGNGTFVQSYRVLPYLGYFEHYRLVDPHERRRRGLGPLARMPSLDRTAAHRFNMLRADADLVTFETTVSTDLDQVALAPGALEAEWVAEGRRHFRYRIETPILHFFTWISGRYDVATERHEGVEISVYHHPAHDANVSRMLDAGRASLETFSGAFGAYPYPRCVIVEIPAYHRFAQSFPGLVPFSESVGFNADLRDPSVIDHVSFTVAHEIAHQWWGHRMIPANVQGAHALLESFAQYSAMMVIEREYGPEHLRRLRTYMLDAYLAQRGLEPIAEMPLYKVEEQPYIHYEKGGIVMAALGDLLGEATLQAALRQMIDRTDARASRYVTTLDFLDALHDVASPAARSLIDDWMREIVIYDLSVDEATARRRDDGRYDVAIRLGARRYVADGQGAEPPLPLDEAIEIGLFARHPDRDPDTAPLHLVESRLTDGANAITVTVDDLPAAVIVDPYVLRVDRNRFDNVRIVAGPSRRGRVLISE